MKSERWQNSKSILLSYQDFRDELRTERQWAKAGYLPVSKDCGKKLRPSRFSTGSVNTLPRYLLPEEVRTASSDELAEYFKPERERKAARDAERRARLKREREKEKEKARMRFALDEQREKVLAITQPVELPAETSGGIVIDTETTGLCAGEDEILQISIISESGEKLFDSYFRPLHKSWSAAQAVNNISPDMVADAPTFCGKTPVYGVFVTSYYFRKEHKLYNSSENLIIPESKNDNISDVIGYPIEEIPNPSIRITSFRCGACNQKWLSSEYKIVSESNGSCSFVKKDMSKPREPSSTFYARFMDICKKNGVKPTPLIKSLGLSTGNLKKWSEGSTVNSNIVKKLAAYFGVSPGYFFSEDEEQPIAGSALDKLCKSAGGGE